LIRGYFIICLFLLNLLTHGNESEVSPNIEFFSIPNSSINAEEISDIKIDDQGSVWIVSFKGLYKYDGEKFAKISVNYNSFGSLIRFYQGENGQRFVIDYLGAIYFVDNDSLVEYEYNSTIRSYYKAYSYSDIFMDKDSRLHFAYRSSGYKTIKDGQVEDPLLDHNIHFDGFACQLRDDKLPFLFRGNKRTPGAPARFYLFDQDFKLIDSLPYSSKKEYNPSSVVQLPNNKFLLSFGDGGLVEFDSKGNIREIDYPDPILNLFVDSDQNLWISTRGKGIHFYKNCQLDFKKKKVLLPESTSFVSAQDYLGGIWLFSQDRGIGYISHPNIIFLEQEQNLQPLVEALEIAEGKIVFADGSKLKILSSKEDIHAEEYFDIGDQIMRLSYDEYRKRLWVSCRGRLLYIQNGQLNEVHNLPKEHRASFSYFNAEWDKEKYSLVATNGYQYFICKDTNISYVSEAFDHKLKSVLFKSDTVFINTGNGIYVKTPDTLNYLGSKHAIAQKSTDQTILFDDKIILSIPSEGVYHYAGNSLQALKFNGEKIPYAKLVKHNDSTLWAISNYGCFKISSRSKNIKKGNPTFYVEAFRGLPRVVLKAACILNEQLFLQTRKNGIGIIDLKEVTKHQLYIPKLIVDKVQTRSKLYHKNFKIPSIPYDDNNIQISFKSLNYHDLEVMYRYQLKGENNEWTTTQTGFVNFVSLSSGKYEFVVQSRFGLGYWSSSQKIKFEIVPPFWQKWWFILFSTLFVLFLVYQIINYRFHIINKEKSLIIGRLTAEQKALRAKMDPHFMFNVMSSLQYLIIQKKNDKASVFLNRFSSLLRNTLNQADIEYISLKDEIQFLKEYINLEKMRLEDLFSYEFEIDPELNLNVQIPTFVLQPFVENSIQHGLRGKMEEGKLSIQMLRMGSFIKVIVEDDGLGYQHSLNTTKKKRVSHGIQTIKDRLKIYNGKQSPEAVLIEDLAILDEHRSGTRVTIIIKIKQL
jgi:hypothetical protein